VDTQGKSIKDTCKHHKLPVQTFYPWRRRFGPLEESEVKRLKEMEKENARHKRLLAERDPIKFQAKKMQISGWCPMRP